MTVDPFAIIEAVFDTPKTTPTANPTHTTVHLSSGGDGSASGASTAYGQRALDAEIERVENATEGTRNDQLFKSAASLYELVAGGVLDETDVTKRLYRAARGIGLLEGEVAATIASGRAKGSLSPRGVPPPRIEAPRPPASTVTVEPVSADTPWERPQPLASGSLPPFPTWTLGRLSTFVERIADDTQTPVDLAGMLTLAVMSAAVGKGARVRVHNTWTEQLSLYIAVALPAGEGKSPVFKRLIAPLRDLEQAQAAEMLPHIIDAQQRRRITEARIKTAEANAAKKYGAEGDDAYAEAHALNMQLAALEIPKTPRLFVDDVTSEALVGVLAETGGQIALLSEEGGIFGTLAGRYSSGQPNLDAVLKAHDGGTIRVDRKTSEPLFVENPALTIGLAVQPSVLRSLADEEALRGRGLIARFLYAVPVSRVGSRDVARRMAETSTQPTSVDFVDVISRLYGARCISCMVSLSEESLSLLTTFSEELERRRHPETGDLGQVLDWSAKLDGATVRLAGLLALAETSTKSTEVGSVDVSASADHMNRAIALGRYLIPHAQAALDLMDPSVVDTEPASRLLRWLRGQGLAEFTVRDAHTALRGQRAFKKSEQVEAATAVLLGHGYLRPVEQPPPKSGRPPSPRYAVNPHDPEGIR